MSAITTLGTRALEILGVEQDAADRLLALLREHPAEPLSTHGAAVAYRRCTERAVGNRSADAAQFATAHASLRARGVGELDRFTALLQRVGEERAVAELLRSTSDGSGSAAPPHPRPPPQQPPSGSCGGGRVGLVLWPPGSAQERCLVSDLLLVLSGYDGLVELRGWVGCVGRLPNCGLAVHALAAAVHELQPACRALALLHSLVCELLAPPDRGGAGGGHGAAGFAEPVPPPPHRGGGLLRLLAERRAGLGGDEDGRALCGFLFRRAAAPFLRSLRQWVYCGVCDDPHGERREFFVVSDPRIAKESLTSDFSCAYWERRFSSRPELTPPALAPHARTALDAGKLLHLARESGLEPSNPRLEQEGGPLSSPDCLLDATALGGALVEARAWANARALQLLLGGGKGEGELFGRLASLKHYFLLDQGDFFAEEELVKPVARISYRVGWPASLVLSRHALIKYQLLFRHLFHCKHECMLRDAPLLKLLAKLLTICVIYADQTRSLSAAITAAVGEAPPLRAGAPHEERAAVRRETCRRVEQLISDRRYARNVETFGQKFDDELLALLAELRKQAHREWNLAHLLARLDFNHFWRQKQATAPAAAPSAVGE
ncbi:hypothetical protein EMIHUDRAFT_455432 [Emiliania huxleyi CCMP1516]|uniref:Spindle pole body component n=2 Tax=Emiliania huxleyi TaxID=2903 RepID=A0A0D3K4R2_EMIH1|nr:hypothetical protein EMIHUDRAFT_456494 [Emiliania huxleyi CCMP1516]XP_005787389.1 hypothetical protein EMIHUDRAFT_455432 [Emiliania huxleyi CCMP1516]EOD30747.1 hypothetical protein EMIHUDRAFT_456494 [Emiliania huxleyi CCMP1516]EOD34960.1 hypothetical protein EMIHUDRAFT_455432 [Emiliania huxleyi CCMP1516]|eukprot:XP_005783176.1 hypothetical protein EMIHUDRAFT_456494 [Emiliania huxleyi CCMP1516]